MRAVNLLPRDADVSSGGSRRLPVLVAVGVVAGLTVLFAMTTLQASSKAAASRGDLELAQSALAALPKVEQEPAAPELATERSNRLAALRTALGTRAPVDRFFRDLSYVVPGDVWLTGLNVTVASDTAQPTPPSAADAPASAVTIDGATYSQAAIARFVSRLGALGSLANAHLTESTRVEPQAEATPGTASAKAKEKRTKRQRAVITFKVAAEFVEGTSS
ncbi:MAG TPA: PilN domain-containing protein [Gaiellaceae bacterium]|jgi:Tfp pilus assembly protein PilN|nr:PilN domain-containing protein [Gaiellaceae bacterium]